MSSVFVMPMFDENIECNRMLNLNNNPTKNEIYISGFQSGKYYEFMNVVCMLKFFEDSFLMEDLDHMPNLLNNKNNNALRYTQHHSKKSLLNKLNITKKNRENMEW